jgi:hypothetical protein
MDLGTKLTQTTLGIDQLYRKQAGGDSFMDKEGLVPVILTDLPPHEFQTWDEVETALQALEKENHSREPGLRRDYVGEMIDSLRTLVATFRGDQLDYGTRVQRCLRVSPAAVSDEIMQSYTRDIDENLRALGYGKGNLADRVKRWESDSQVPVDKVLPTLRQLLQIARERTQDRLFPLPEVTLEPAAIRAVPFSAYCDYPGRRLLLNVDYPYTMPGLKHLACHEGFPGHAVHLAVREAKTRNGEMPLDGALVVTNSASSPIFEGIGENGIYFLDWIEGPADKLGVALTRLRSAARINAALMIHTQGKSAGEARDYLMRSCYLNQSQAESRLGFLTHKLRAPFIFAYWQGDMAVSNVWVKVSPAQRQEFFHYLYDHMHTPTTLETYWDPVRI